VVGGPLLAAIRKRNLHLTKRLLAAGAAVNDKMANHNLTSPVTSVLPAIVDWGHYPLIQEIINAGAEIDAPEKIGGKTALCIAVEKNDMKAIKLLIDAGANVNSPEAVFSSQTALRAAARNNDLQMVQYLLGLGADSDESSLVLAMSGSLELVQTLLAARRDRYKRYSKGYGCGALQYAIRLKSAIMIKALLANGIDPNVILRRKFGDNMAFSYHCSEPSGEPDLSSGESALGSALRQDKSKGLWMVRMLLSGGADPNSIVNDDRQTALLVAIDENNTDLVKMLIAAGADANPALRYGVKLTPLQLAVWKGRIEIVNILLENNANINAPPFDRYGATALQFAAIGGCVGIAQLLIRQGADVNAPPAKIGGRTALEGAAEHGRIDMLQLLLSAGAQITGTGLAQYNRARELALENGHRAACRLLEKFSKDLLENLPKWDDMCTDFSDFSDVLLL
jgi:ankyrin repeat protein